MYGWGVRLRGFVSRSCKGEGSRGSRVVGMISRMEEIGEMGMEETKMGIGVEVMIRMVEIKEIKMETKMAMEMGMEMGMGTIMEMTTMGEEEITTTTMETRMETITTIATGTKIKIRIRTKTKTKARTTETETAMAMTTTTATTTMETDVSPE